MLQETRRLLLVEFAATDRFHRAVLFPYIKGHAAGCEIETWWIRFGISAPKGRRSSSEGVMLDKEEIASLAKRKEELEIDTILFSHPPAPMLVKSLSEGRKPRMAALEGSVGKAHGEDENGVVPLGLDGGGLSELLGRPIQEQGAFLFENTTPDFHYEEGNKAAELMEPLFFFFLGPECSFNRSFARNRFLEGLDLSGCIRKGGCAFCASPETRAGWKVPPMELFERQLDALGLFTEQRRWKKKVMIRMVGEPVIRRLPEIAELLLDREGATSSRKTPALDLLIDSRVDLFLANLEGLRKACRLLRGSRHTVCMSLMGVESFASKELHRMNKGLSPEQSLEAITELFELEREHSEVFSFRRFGGLSMITFTPWTAPWELGLNLWVIRAAGLEQMSGKALTGRLRLYEGLALTEAAQRDHLLFEAYQDPLFDTSRLNMYPEEIPWSFLHPLMSPINQVLLRLAYDPGTASASGAICDSGVKDPVDAALERRFPGLERGTNAETVDLALSVVDLAVEHAHEGLDVDPALLVEEAAARKEALRSAQANPLERWTLFDEVFRDGSMNLGGLGIDALFQLKPVVKVEPVPVGELHLWMSRADLPNLKVRTRQSASAKAAGPEGPLELFFGRDREEVDEAVFLTGKIEGESDPEELSSAVIRLGSLLGYPECCSRVFAAESKRIVSSYYWLWVKRRITASDEVPFELNPVANPLMEYVPCSLSCGPSLERARKTAALLAESNGSRYVEQVLERLRHPVLLFWGEQQQAMELLPREGEKAMKLEEDQGELLVEFRAGNLHGESPLLRWAAQGDTIRIGSEVMTATKDGSLVAVLSGRAFLWWHERKLQARFFKAMLDLVEAAGLEEALLHSQRARDGGAPSSPFLLFTSNLLDSIRREGRSFEGYMLQRMEHTSPDSVRVFFTGEEDLVLDLAPRKPRKPCYLAAGPYALTYPSIYPLKTQRMQKAVQEFARELLSHLKEKSV